MAIQAPALARIIMLESWPVDGKNRRCVPHCSDMC